MKQTNRIYCGGAQASCLLLPVVKAALGDIRLNSRAARRSAARSTNQRATQFGRIGHKRSRETPRPTDLTPVGQTLCVAEVPGRGFEPPRYCYHMVLSHAQSANSATPGVADFHL